MDNIPVLTEEDSKTQWLTQILRQSLRISNTNEVISFNSEMLKGGCHFNVLKLSLIYSEPNSKLPTSVVLKTLKWNKTIVQKIILCIKKTLNVADREAIYLNSYEVETRFYKIYSTDIQGLRLPQILFSYENPFHHHFVMVMEDISHCENGQPLGFSMKDSMICLKYLAEFHATHWDHPTPKTNAKFWDIGGYWTGKKREANKKEIRKAWDHVFQYFHEDLQISESSKSLGVRLEHRLDDIALIMSLLEPRTLIHGDFKITNIFINHNNHDFYAESTTTEHVYAIDWQWFGIGNVALDVAHFIATSIHENSIQNSLELLHYYYRTLLENGISAEQHSWEKFWKNFQLCWIDFFIFTVVAKWGTMKPNDIELYQKEEKDGLHLRSYPHMRKLLIQTEEFINDLETSLSFKQE
ncbi:unnamed protein product [Didymodactylos carnosus]|uniref:CHK kinase-like domain-containing protein n=1 Tax=Didymodactylos carnosus TaxID=1234261 RepID=A0A815U7X1_9BILA|nr:unnamed protein product [Didymodactylos carnosus]CAF4374259.1 unnamed protein product [Didymodactylos carnosus]